MCVKRNAQWFLWVFLAWFLLVCRPRWFRFLTGNETILKAQINLGTCICIFSCFLFLFLFFFLRICMFAQSHRECVLNPFVPRKQALTSNSMHHKQKQNMHLFRQCHHQNCCSTLYKWALLYPNKQNLWMRRISVQNSTGIEMWFWEYFRWRPILIWAYSDNAGPTCILISAGLGLEIWGFQASQTLKPAHIHENAWQSLWKDCVLCVLLDSCCLLDHVHNSFSRHRRFFWSLFWTDIKGSDC